MSLTRTPQIDQIKIKDQVYEINVPKSWAENDENSVQYIKDRTHFKTLLLGNEIPEEARYAFQNGYYTNGALSYVDVWQPGQSWLYAGEPCTCDSTAEHQENQECSGRYYKAKLIVGDFTLFDGEIELTKSFATLPSDTVFDTISSGTAEATKYVLIDINKIVKYQDPMAEYQPEKSNWAEGTENYNTWAKFKLWYHPNHQFYMENEPVSEEGIGTQCTLILTPVTSKQYKLTKRIDIDFLPLDYKTVKRDPEGNITIDDTYSADFVVTEQFGHYAPLSTVPAKGKAVKDVLNDAFCKDVQPTITDPYINFVISGGKKVEVGTTLDLTWNLQFNRGAYTYGTLVAPSGPKTTYPSNLEAKTFKITASNSSVVNAIKVGSNTVDLNTDTSFLTADNCSDTYDSGKTYKTLINNGTVQFTMPKTPTATVSLTAKINAACNRIYSSATMLEKQSAPLVEFDDDNFTKLTKTTSTAVSSDYRWFWAYNKDFNEVKANLRNTEIVSSQLSSFPNSMETTNLQEACFIAPNAAKLTGISMTNTATGASACISWSSETISVTDPGGNTHEYTMYFFKNASPDSGKNTYKIEVIK